jgi:hypothetical protein
MVRELNCPRNLYNLSKGYFSHRTAIMSTNNVRVEKRITKGCPEGSCCGPGYWNVLYNSLLNMQLTTHSKIIAFADDLMIVTRGDSIAEAENYTNIEMRKIQKWAENNKMKFNENKFKVMLMTRRRKKEKKEIGIYINDKTLKQVNTINYLGIIFDSKLLFREQINNIEGKCLKLIFALSRSAKVTGDWDMRH